MCQFWYDYIKPKYEENAASCYMDTDSFKVYMKTKDVCRDIAKNVETRFDTSDYKINRPLHTGKIKKRNWIN